MSGLADLCTVILAGLIHASLQLGTSCLLLLYHASLGQHIKRRTKILAKNFVLGMALFVAMAVSTAGFMTITTFSGAMPTVSLIVVIGILIGVALAIWLFYYRKSSGTELWIPRAAANFLYKRADATADNVEAFSMGMLAACMEMPFSVSLIFVAANSILGLPQGMQILAVVLYTGFAILPLIVMQLAVKNGKTVIDIQKWRVKNKAFIKIMSGVGYITLAIFLIAFKVMKDF